MSPAPTYKGMQELVIGQSIFSYMRFLILSTCGALFTSIANHLLCSFYQHQHCHFELLIGSEGEHWSPVVVIGDHWYRSVSYASVSQWPLVNRVLTRIFKTGVRDSSIWKNRSPSQNLGVQLLKTRSPNFRRLKPEYIGIFIMIVALHGYLRL